MIELLGNLNHWHWLAFGFALLAVEVLGTAGYFLWLGISAVVVGIIMALVPLDWQIQWITFGLLSLITTWLWWRKQKQNDATSDEQRDLNQKQKQLIGKTIILDEDLEEGRGRIKIGDTTWPASSEEFLAAGTKVKVDSVDGITLIIVSHNNE
ncbi:NfeD family protein [Vibrio marisflavi]|uniref:Inner membrane protein YbbJ n=1 Tax=Vibrio marisflavi CECT 7928 TaxID=634439 RepID=A0ABN8E1W8_9VIBR|nr:NfeD family protein [Vibrio marisflavi]CAH0539015.1 Inner membrane protein YbbJ [Vibrio marisflavi CECT 7928]